MTGGSLLPLLLIFMAAALIIGAAIFVLTMRRGAELRAADPTEEMDAESRSMYSPIRRLVTEIEEIVQRNQGSAIMKVVGGEAVQEAERIRDQVARALAVRDDLKRAMRGKNVARNEIEGLRARAQAATSDIERDTLLSAMEARKLELSHYDTVDEVLQRIDASVRQAQAALSEMKARLSVKASNELAAEAAEDGDLRETIGRLKQLSISYDEAEELLRH
jgi:hypothetical protein